jgi:hypothetical protein
MLHKLREQGLKALAKVINPPVNAPSSMKGKVSIVPGAVNYVDTVSGDQGVRPTFLVDPDLNAIGVYEQQSRESIKNGFFSDLFLSLSNKPNMTATEVLERHEEKLLLLGPVIERVMPELLDPLLDLVFDACFRAGIIPDAPPELGNSNISVEYISPLAQAQKAVGVSSIEQVASFVGNLSGIMPEVLDIFDGDEAVKQYADMLGIPPKVLRGELEVEQLRQARQQAQAQEQAQEQASQRVQGAKLLSETSVTGDTALTRIAPAL